MIETCLSFIGYRSGAEGPPEIVAGPSDWPGIVGGDPDDPAMALEIAADIDPGVAQLMIVQIVIAAMESLADRAEREGSSINFLRRDALVEKGIGRPRADDSAGSCG